eukprot:m.261453 g.261453  ORF g.261453 m.261453 type:complete len:130 (+) comp26782_c1_seq10:101-490(+)
MPVTLLVVIRLAARLAAIHLVEDATTRDHHLAVAAHLHLVVVARLHLAVRAAHQDVAVPLLHAGLQRHKQCWGEGRGGVMLCCMVVWLCVLCLCVAACAVFVCVWLCVLNDAKTSVKVDIQQMNVESIK